MPRLTSVVLLLLAISLTACQRQSLTPAEAESTVRSLYTQVLSRPPLGLPDPAGVQAYAPYLSDNLHQQLVAAGACMTGFYAQNTGSNGKPEVSWPQLRLFIGDTFEGDKRPQPESLKIDRSDPQPDGTIRVSVQLSHTEASINSEIPAFRNLPPYISTTPVAVLLKREHGHAVVDDVIYQSRHTRWKDENTQETYLVEDARLSQYLAVGCGPTARLVQGLYSQLIALNSRLKSQPTDWTPFAPYLSQSLQLKINTANACADDWLRQNPYPPLKAPRPSPTNLIAEDDWYTSIAPSNLELERIETQSDGSVRALLHVTAQDNLWHIAPRILQENGHLVIDDVAYLYDADWDGYPAGAPPARTLTGYLAAGCDGPRWLRHTLPADPAAFVQSFYTQIVTRHPTGVPSGEDWKAISPYFSKNLLRRIASYNRCEARLLEENAREEARQHSPIKPPGLFEDGLFSGGDELADPDRFQIDRVQPQPNGSVRVDVTLHWTDDMAHSDHPDTVTWHVAAILVPEDGRYALDDVIMLKDKHINQDKDEPLSQILAFTPQCRTPQK